MGKINKEKQDAMQQKVLLELFEYNSTTGNVFNKTNRGSRARKGQPAGCLNKDGYMQVRINGNQQFVHRVVWVMVYGDYPDGEQPYIDHINGKKADNRIENLRASSGAENNRNQKMTSRNTSGITGVHRHEKKGGSKNCPRIYYYWTANWYDENGKQQRKNFPIHKLGEDEAKQMAIEYRAEQLHLLEQNHGIIYSERHGTEVH